MQEAKGEGSPETMAKLGAKEFSFKHFASQAKEQESPPFSQGMREFQVDDIAGSDGEHLQRSSALT